MAAKPNFTAYTSPMYGFEESFDRDAFYSWIVENWTLSIWYSVAYVMLVFVGKYYMDKRERFDLRVPLMIWSGLLAVFSIFGAIRTVPELMYLLRKYGFENSVCNPSYFYGSTAFWAYAFTISKLYELGDTAFIILRKQPLIFLHWYHHATVFVYVWYSYTDHTAPGRWFMVMNYSVHSVMYTYYTLRAMRIRVPKPVNMFITSMQIAQMVMGMVVIISAYQYKKDGHYCQMSLENMRYCFIMYSSYLVLFSYFFYQAYIKPRVSVMKPEKSEKKYTNGVSNGVQQNGIERKVK